jgi:hypothetical protein
VVTEFHEAQMDKNGVPYGPRGRAIYSRRMMSADPLYRYHLSLWRHVYGRRITGDLQRAFSPERGLSGDIDSQRNV